MPELPDVEVFRRHLAATSLHRRITQTSIDQSRLVRDGSPRQVARHLKGQEFESTHRHGKYLFVRLSNGNHLMMHFGMTGRVQFIKPSDDCPEYTSAVFSFDDNTALAYISQRLLGQMAIVEDIEQFVADQELGPDVLDLPRSDFVELLGKKRGAIKTALMDQSTLAGIGNIYSDEILFQMKLYPRTKVNELSEKELHQLYRVTQRVLQTAIRHEANPDDMPRGYLLPHRDDDGKCPCGGELRKLKISSRHAVYCPRCQPA